MGLILVSWLETGQWVQSWREAKFAKTGCDGPTLRGKGLTQFWACWASKKALMASEQPPWSTQQVSELPQGTGAPGTVPALAPWQL